MVRFDKSFPGQLKARSVQWLATDPMMREGITSDLTNTRKSIVWVLELGVLSRLMIGYR